MDTELALFFSSTFLGALTLSSEPILTELNPPHKADTEFSIWSSTTQSFILHKARIWSQLSRVISEVSLLVKGISWPISCGSIRCWATYHPSHQMQAVHFLRGLNKIPSVPSDITEWSAGEKGLVTHFLRIDTPQLTRCCSVYDPSQLSIFYKAWERSQASRVILQNVLLAKGFVRHIFWHLYSKPSKCCIVYDPSHRMQGVYFLQGRNKIPGFQSDITERSTSTDTFIPYFILYPKPSKHHTL